MTDAGLTEERLRALRELGGKLSDPALKSTARLLILVSLAINGRLSFQELSRLTGLGKGSLSNHLDKLESARLIRTKRALVWGGHRVVAEVTREGMEAYQGYIGAMKAIEQGGSVEVSPPGSGGEAPSGQSG